MAKNPNDPGTPQLRPTDSVPAVTVPVAARPPATLEESMRQLAQVVTGLAQTVGAMATSQAKLTADLAGIVGDREEDRRKLHEEIANQEKKRVQAEKGNRLVTQERADALWPVADDRYKVALMIPKRILNEATGKMRTLVVPAGDFPVLEINASSPEEADGRYRKLCGIVATEHTIRAVPADQQLANRSEDQDEQLPSGVMAVA